MVISAERHRSHDVMMVEIIASWKLSVTRIQSSRNRRRYSYHAPSPAGGNPLFKFAMTFRRKVGRISPRKDRFCARAVETANKTAAAKVNPNLIATMHNAAMNARRTVANF